MTEKNSTFTAPVAGWYHVVTGQEPHLIADCTDECRYRTMSSGTPVEIPTGVVAVPWNHE